MARKRVTRGSFHPLPSMYVTADDIDVAGIFSRGNGLQGEADFGLLAPAVGPFRLRFYQSINGSAFALSLSATVASSNDILGSPCGSVLATGQTMRSYVEFCTPSGELLYRSAVETQII